MTHEFSASDFERMLKDYRLTTAEIIYHLPDHPQLLQSYVWQELDLAPKFPILTKFLDFWESELEGKLHSVTVDHTKIIQPSDWKLGKGEFLIH